MSTNNEERVTPYRAAKIANAYFEKVGVKTVPPQMLYNYSYARLNANKRPLIACTREGILVNDAVAWAQAYAAKKLASTQQQGVQPVMQMSNVHDATGTE